MKYLTDDVLNRTFWRNLVLIAAGLGLYFVMLHLDAIWGRLRWFIGLLAPFMWGFVFAFLLNGPMVYLEKNTFASVKNKKKRRLWSLATTLVISLSMIVILFAFMIPQLGESLSSLESKLPDYVATLQSYLRGFWPSLEISVDSVTSWLDKFLDDDGMAKIFYYSGQVASGVINVFIGLVVAVYLLYNKESYARQTKMAAYALLPDVWVYRTLRVLRFSNRTFTGFFYSKLIDSLAVGVICFVAMVIFGMKYALLISVIVGVTNIIPFFGPFIGAIPAIIILLAVDPLQALWFAIFILVLQQFDGNIMGPRIMSNSIGLPAIWVMFAIVVGGGMFGFVGMILGIPVFAMIYELASAYIKERYGAVKLEKPTLRL